MRRGSAQERGQRGSSLIEIVISVMLVSIVVLGLAAGFLTLVRTNRMTYEQQLVNHAAGNYAESLKSVAYLPCSSSTTPDYDSAPDLWQPGNSVQVHVADVEYWNPTTRDYQEACPAADGGTQRLTVLAEMGARVRQAQIVIRNR